MAATLSEGNLLREFLGSETCRVVLVGFCAASGEMTHSLTLSACAVVAEALLAWCVHLPRSSAAMVILRCTLLLSKKTVTCALPSSCGKASSGFLCRAPTGIETGRVLRRMLFPDDLTVNPRGLRCTP